MTHKLDEMAEKLAREVPATHKYYYQELTRACRQALTQAYNQAIEDAARVCNDETKLIDQLDWVGNNYANAIRQLKK